MPVPARIGDPFDPINDAFHEGYDAAREGDEENVPILVVLADELIRFRGDERRTFHVSPRSFHVIKSVAHAPLAVFTALDRDDPLDEHRRLRLRALQQKLAAARGDNPELDDILEQTHRFIDDALARHPGHAKLAAFAAKVGPELLRLTDLATGLQLEALGAATDEALAVLDADEKRTYVVVVTGDHQARARSLAMQYFQKRLGESGKEKRVLYGEAITTADEARALVGTNRLDRRIARAFFGDASRLQRDILGDAAKARLEGPESAPV